MRFFIITDLEGVVGVDSFSQTRDTTVETKTPGMKQLSREVNACAAGLRDVYPAAEVAVWDGHGSFGIYQDDLDPSLTYIGKTPPKPYRQIGDYDAVLFVGQHAMAGTFGAPLCHTYSSLKVAYYKLNGVYIGEFGAMALQAGLQGVPTIFISGDDKAVLEAQIFVPNVETVVVKWGKGQQAAVHRDRAEVDALLRAGAAQAAKRMSEISPFSDLYPPYTFEARYYQPINADKWTRPEAKIIDSYTVQITTDDINTLPI